MSEPVLVAGRYRLDTVLGRGGMGQVWEAHDEMLGRRVAVKEVRWPADMPTDEREVLHERTMREARVTARLSHPGVVTIYDVVSHDGRPFIVMELLAAASLDDAVEEHGHLPAARVAEIGLEILSALEAAHEQGVVHRDVKPSNVMLRKGGRVVLTDFGIASSHSDANLTTTGLLVGSPSYMSPERLRGSGIAPPADLWSLGVTLFTAATGAPPFRADNTMGTITAVLANPTPDPGVRGPLRDAILGLLNKDPATRLTADQVRPLLEAAAQDQQAADSAGTMPFAAPGASASSAIGTAAAESTQTDTETRTSPRRSRRLPLLAAVAVLLLGGAVVTATLLDDDGADTDTAATDEETTDAEATPSDDGVTPSDEEATPSDEETTPSEDETTPSDDETTTDPSEEDVPDGYELRDDPLGFSVAVPEGSARSLDGPTRVDYTVPGGNTLLRVDQIPEAGPDAEQAWLDAEPSVSDGLEGYERIRIDPLTYREWEAADWEYTWEGDNGTVHALNRGFITDPRGFALYVSGPDETWERESLPVFDAATDTFQPTD